jgi:GT2 family glycosyltransferase
MPPPPPDLSVCLVNHGNARLLRECLRSIFEHTRGPSFEVIVVDNHSSDDSVDLVRREFSSVRLLCNPSARSYAPNMNQALRAARGRFVAMMNDDTRLAGNALGAMAAFLAGDPETGAVGPKLLNPDGSFQIGPRGPITLWNLVCWDAGADRLFPRSRLFGALSMRSWDPDRSCDMHTASGACLVVRREVLDTIGLLDETIPMGADDIDLSLRIRAAGWRLRYLADAQVIHHRSVSRSRTPVDSMLKHYAALYAICARYRGRGAAATFRAWVTVGAGLRVVSWSVLRLLPRWRRSAPMRIRVAWNVMLANLRRDDRSASVDAAPHATELPSA